MQWRQAKIYTYWCLSTFNTIICLNYWNANLWRQSQVWHKSMPKCVPWIFLQAKKLRNLSLQRLSNLWKWQEKVQIWKKFYLFEHMYLYPSAPHPHPHPPIHNLWKICLLRNNFPTPNFKLLIYLFDFARGKCHSSSKNYVKNSQKTEVFQLNPSIYSQFRLYLILVN